MPPRQPLMPRLRARRPGMAVVDLEANRLGGLPSAVGGIARLAYARARAAGLDVDPLLSQASLTREQIEDSGVRLRVRDQIKFLNLVADALPDDLLGFHLAQVCELRAIGLLYYVAASSDTLGEVLKRASRYSTIVNEGVSLTCTSNGDIGITFDYIGVSRHLDRHQIEFFVTTLVRTLRQLTDHHLVPIRVRLIHRRNGASFQFREFFG